MKGGRVSHSWCMCVVVMAMVGWMGAGMELVFGRHAGQSHWSVFLEMPNTGRHEKAPVRCPCSRLAALHGAPRTRNQFVRRDSCTGPLSGIRSQKGSESLV